jgi:hypothetical protein
MSLVENIRTAAMGSAVPLDEVLRQCLVLAARLKYEPFRIWVIQELNGYPPDAELPSYRSIRVQIQFNAISLAWKANKQSVPPGVFPPELAKKATAVDLPSGVAQIEAWAENRDGVRLSLPGDVYHHLANCVQNGELTSAWYAVSGEALRGVLSTIRTRIVEFTLEIEEAFPNLEDVPPGPGEATTEKVAHIFNVTVLGAGNVVNLGGGSGFIQNVQQHVAIGDLESLKAFLREQGIESAELVELDEVIKNAGANDLTDEQSGIRRWIDKATKSISGGSKKLVQEAIKELVLLSIRYYFGELTDAPDPKSGQ